MKKVIILTLLLLIVACKKKNKIEPAIINSQDTIDFTIAFGSCNNQNLPNPFWDIILKNNPDVWIWGGDNIYADTDNMELLSNLYENLKSDSAYANLDKNADILGTWDDHDYGLNDGGEEFIKKDSSQSLFLDFLDVPFDHPRRTRKGIYDHKIYRIKDKSINIITLDTRFFRSPLTPDSGSEKRYQPQSTGTILGEDQWNWLKDLLTNSASDYHIIVSSIQILSKEHGFETWGNMPHEIEKLSKLISSTQAKRVLILSGDRHISELSKVNWPGINYPIYDFTSSGLTHSYESFSGESNPLRVSKVVSEKSFGLLKFNLNTHTVTMEMRGLANELIFKNEQQYK